MTVHGALQRAQPVRAAPGSPPSPSPLQTGLSHRTRGAARGKTRAIPFLCDVNRSGRGGSAGTGHGGHGGHSRSHFVLRVEDGRDDILHLAVARPRHPVHGLPQRGERGVDVEPQRLLDHPDAEQVAGPAGERSGGGSSGDARPAARPPGPRPPPHRLNTLPIFCSRFPAMARGRPGLP